MATLHVCAGLSSFALSPVGSRRLRSSGPSARLSLRRNLTIQDSRISDSKVSKSPSTSLGFVSSSITETHLRVAQMDIFNLGKSSGRGGALGTLCSLPASPETIRWVFVVAATVLLFLKNTGIPKQFLVPLLALELPNEALGWLKGDYGLWTAFLALAVKLFYYIPGELELPLYLLLVVITAPFRLTQFRGSLPAALATLVITAYLAYRHYQYSGSVQGAFQTDKIFGTLALVVLFIIPIVFLVNGVYY